MIRLMLGLLLTLQANAGRGEFRIVGYYSLKEAMNADLSAFPFDRLTHINLYFMNPDTAGNFHTNFEPIRKFIDAAHLKGIKVLPSIGGGGRHEYYHALLKDNKRTRLVNELNKIVQRYNFDGSVPTSMNYKQIIANYPGAEQKDEIKLPSGATMYYNGAETIRRKTVLAKTNASGIMIWQIMGDADGEHSLLKIISNVREQNTEARE